MIDLFQDIKSPILLSLKIASLTTIFTMIIGMFLARIFIKKKFIGKDILEVLITLPMVLPPSVVGYLLLIIIGKRGPIGSFLFENFGIRIIFTWVAACIAACVVSLPLMYQSVKSAFLKVDENYENAARTLGASEWRVFREVTIPLAWPGIVSGIVLSFARALGEFGATMMVAGYIPGKTETIPTAIYFAVESNELEKANILIGIVIFFSFIMILLLNRWMKKQKVN